jgi:predicted nucleic acid-binding protein
VTPTDFTECVPLFVDTNVFLRFLTDDVPEQAAAVEALFRRAAA